MALIASGQWPLRFPDDAVLELPGLFHDAREVTLSYTGLIHANALKGYEDFFVIGAFSNGPGNIHSRKHLTSLSDLKGMKIGATSTIEAAALERLGAVSHVLPVPQAMDAISDGSIDGTAAAPAVFAAFGIGRVTTYHYLLPISGAPLSLVMNRKRFDGLPEQAQSVIRKYSGEWMATGFVAHWQDLEKRELERIKSNARRIMTFPSPMDIEAAQAVFQSVNDEWAAKSPRNLELLMLVEKELAKIRSTPKIADVPMALQSSPN
jgi:TRAP-type C4-dicarboxylate transport system substrate-binding protein